MINHRRFFPWMENSGRPRSFHPVRLRTAMDGGDRYRMNRRRTGTTRFSGAGRPKDEAPRDGIRPNPATFWLLFGRSKSNRLAPKAFNQNRRPVILHYQASSDFHAHQPIRHLKGEKHLMKFHNHTVGSIRIKQKQVPQIRLFGQWLERSSFHPGREFIVYELSDCLFLAPPPPEEAKKEEAEV
jgi:hypothetical protein